MQDQHRRLHQQSLPKRWNLQGLGGRVLLRMSSRIHWYVSFCTRTGCRKKIYRALPNSLQKPQVRYFGSPCPSSLAACSPPVLTVSSWQHCKVLLFLRYQLRDQYKRLQIFALHPRRVHRRRKFVHMLLPSGLHGPPL